jgi:hypothetical protein
LLFRVERIPEAEGVVGRVPVLRGDSGLGADPREILRLLALGGVGRIRVEPDSDVDRVGFAYDVESSEFVRQCVAAVGVVEGVTEVSPGVPFEWGPPDWLGPIPGVSIGRSPQRSGFATASDRLIAKDF